MGSSHLLQATKTATSYKDVDNQTFRSIALQFFALYGSMIRGNNIMTPQYLRIERAPTQAFIYRRVKVQHSPS